MVKYMNPKKWLSLLLMVGLAGCASQGTTPGTEASTTYDTYEQGTIAREAESFFGKGAEGVADVLNKIFSEKGRPNGYVTGEEGGGAIGVGVRYGNGTLHLKNSATRKVYWRGPSIGIDFGGNAAKTFMLIYDLPSEDALYQRFPGVDGSLYFVGGMGVNYNHSGGITLAPIRFGVGWRQGINLGYIHMSNKRSWIPF
jgi:hypothetical protein